nr:hypothetical protein [Streptomyces finlayi]
MSRRAVLGRRAVLLVLRADLIDRADLEAEVAAGMWRPGTQAR